MHVHVSNAAAAAEERIKNSDVHNGNEAEACPCIVPPDMLTAVQLAHARTSLKCRFKDYQAYFVGDCIP